MGKIFVHFFNNFQVTLVDLRFLFLNYWCISKLTSCRLDTVRVALGPQAKAAAVNTSTPLPTPSPLLVPSSPLPFFPISFYFGAQFFQSVPPFLSK